MHNKDRKKTKNFTLFRKNLKYQVKTIAEKLGVSPRTISEQWKAKGLVVENGKVDGANLIEFLKNQKNKRKVAGDSKGKYYCLHTKTLIDIILRHGFTTIEYYPDLNRFQAVSKCFGEFCSNKNCDRKVNEQFRLNKFISKEAAIKIYENSSWSYIYELTPAAIESIKKLIGGNDAK